MLAGRHVVEMKLALLVGHALAGRCRPRRARSASAASVARSRTDALEVGGACVLTTSRGREVVAVGDLDRDGRAVDLRRRRRRTASPPRGPPRRRRGRPTRRPATPATLPVGVDGDLRARPRRPCPPRPRTAGTAASTKVTSFGGMISLRGFAAGAWAARQPAIRQRVGERPAIARLVARAHSSSNR